METLQKAKLKMKTDKDFKKALVRSAKDEILIDLDGDGESDIALMDSTGDGNIDTLAVDLTGDGEFDLYFHESDGRTDLVLLNNEGDGAAEILGFGEEVKESMILGAHNIMTMLALGEYKTEDLDSALDTLQKEIGEARKQRNSDR